MSEEPNETQIAEASRLFGALGGKSGKGKSKRRSKEHYKRMGELSGAARRKKKKVAKKK